MKGAEAILQVLIEEGVDTFFGYPGGGIMPFYDELYKYTDRLNHILVRHEQAAVHAAEGYARSSGRTGVCVATAGPGATNLVTGIADAMMDSTPVVCIAAQVQKAGLGSASFQEADIISITMPITKWNYEITGADEIAPVLAKAFRIAASGRPGPVVISITKNAQTEETDFLYRKEPEPPVQRSEALEEALDRAVAMIEGSERPLVIAGQGVILSNAEAALQELACRACLPVATTLLGLSSIPSGHPNFVGCVGMHGSLAPNGMTQRADLILAVGMRFSDRVTGNAAGYAPHAKIIHVEVDPAEIGKSVRADLPVVADARVALEGLLERKPAGRPRSDWWRYAAEISAKEAAVLIPAQLSDERGLTMARVVDQISKRVGNDKIVVADVGQNQMFSARFSHFDAPRSWITSGGLGTMGYGLPAAIGAKLANPDKHVIAYFGDGGFQMNMQEMGTLLQTGAAVKMVLLNNSWLGMVRQWQELFYDRRYSFTHLDNPDFQKIASAYGIPSLRIDAVGELDGAIDRMMASRGAFLLEACTVPEENVFPMIPAGASLDSIFIDNLFRQI